MYKLGRIVAVVLLAAGTIAVIGCGSNTQGPEEYEVDMEVMQLAVSAYIVDSGRTPTADGQFPAKGEYALIDFDACYVDADGETHCLIPWYVLEAPKHWDEQVWYIDHDGLVSVDVEPSDYHITPRRPPIPPPTTAPTPKPEFRVQDVAEFLEFTALLPPHFEAIDPAGEGMSNKDLGLGTDCGEVAVYLREEPYQMLWAVGCVFEMTRTERVAGDASFRADDQIRSMLEQQVQQGAMEVGIYDLAFTDFHIDHPSIGDVAVSGKAVLETFGFFYGFDTVWFREENVLVYTYSTYYSEGGRVLLEPLAESLVERLRNWPSDGTMQEEPVPTSKPTSAPPFGPTPSPVSTGALLFSDSFDSPFSGWETYSESEGSASYSSGALHIYDYAYGLRGENSYVDRNFADFILEVETWLVAGSENNWHYIICRSDLVSSYYGFGVSADGYYTIFKFVNGELTTLAAPRFSGFINTGQGIRNLARVECVGSTLSLWANGNLLATVDDSSFSSGYVALGCEAMGSTSTEVAFDNFVIASP